MPSLFSASAWPFPLPKRWSRTLLFALPLSPAKIFLQKVLTTPAQRAYNCRHQLNHTKHCEKKSRHSPEITENPGSCEGAFQRVLKMVLELRTEQFICEATTGLPVTAIEYNPAFIRPAVLDKAVSARAYSELRWYHGVLCPVLGYFIQGRGFLHIPYIQK